MKFERQRRHVILDAASDVYRVSWDPVNSENRRTKDPLKHLVGISTAVMYWDAVFGRKGCQACANTIKMAWDAGDRYLLDTEDARSKAEIVANLSVTHPDEDDLCAAISDLSNCIASVKLSSLSYKDFDVVPVCGRAIAACMASEGYDEWSNRSRRLKFIYSLKQSERTEVVCALASLYFQEGQTPILTSHQRKELMEFDRGEGLQGALDFFEKCLVEMTSYLIRQ